MRFDAEFIERVLAALKEAKIEAVIVGNVAAMLQGAPVTTQDLDFVIRDTPLNRKKLQRLGEALSVPPPAVISELTSTMRLHGLEWPIDFLLDRIGGGLTFASLKSRASGIPIGRERALVASLEDVIRSKEAADRPKDRAMLPILRDTLLVKKVMEE